MRKNDYLEKAKTYKGFHYSVIDENELEYLHNRTLEMFDQVKLIFDKNNIKYMICGGTLLGALGSGKGRFIPWDDDFDVCIFEEDYQKAIDCLTDSEEGLKNDTVLQCTKTDSNYYLGWMKVRDRKSHVYPDASVFKENGVWIDLYKLVSTKAIEVPTLIAREAIAYLDRRLLMGGITEEEYQKRIEIGNLKENLEKALQVKMMNTDEKLLRNVFIIWSASKVVLEQDWVEPIREVEFEGRKLTTFYKADEYLKNHYGDTYVNFPDDDLRRIGINKINIK